MQFSLRFKQLCKENGVTQKKAFEDMNMHRNSAQRWTEGNPSAEALIKIADYFGMTIDEVLGKEQKEAPTPENGSERKYDDKEMLEAFHRSDEATMEVIRLLLKSRGFLS